MSIDTTSDFLFCCLFLPFLSRKCLWNEWSIIAAGTYWSFTTCQALCSVTYILYGKGRQASPPPWEGNCCPKNVTEPQGLFPHPNPRPHSSKWGRQTQLRSVLLWGPRARVVPPCPWTFHLPTGGDLGHPRLLLPSEFSHCLFLLLPWFPLTGFPHTEGGVDARDNCVLCGHPGPL